MVVVVGEVEITGCVGCVVPAELPLAGETIIGVPVPPDALIVGDVAATFPDGLPLIGGTAIGVLAAAGVWK